MRKIWLDEGFRIVLVHQHATVDDELVVAASTSSTTSRCSRDRSSAWMIANAKREPPRMPKQEDDR